MNRNISFLIRIILLFCFYPIAATEYKIGSPDKHLQVTIELRDKIYYKVNLDEKNIIAFSPVMMSVENGISPGENPILKKINRTAKNDTIVQLTGRRKYIPDIFNEMTLELKGGYSFIVRVYNEAFAFRFQTSFSETINIKNEEVGFRFPEEVNLIYIPKYSYLNTGEGVYKTGTIASIPDTGFALVPAMAVFSDGLKVLITESDLFDYPGLNLTKDDQTTNSLKGKFFFRSQKEAPTGRSNWRIGITEWEPYIAKTNGTRSFPWRIGVVSRDDKLFADCDIVYKLATPTRMKDISWVKPGQVAWDWWFDWNIEKVNFKAKKGSTEFYQYMIDFASEYQIPFLEVSEEWSEFFDPSKPIIDMDFLSDYAQKKNVGLLMWVIAHPFEAHYDKTMELFTKWKIAGIKVDFLDRDDQRIVKLYEKIAKDCAERKMLVYYHGAYKPTGMERTYPNIITYEGVLGNEHNKWSSDCSPRHCVMLPFLRNLAGPMDFTPGAMMNANQKMFQPIFERPMSQGTRCMQIAEYIVFFSPTQMLCDAPSAYLKEKECFDFMRRIPTVWDNSMVLDGAIGEFLVMCRQKGQNWYIGGMNNEMEKEIKLNFSFLPSGDFEAEIFQDGLNANRSATDYQTRKITITSSTTLPLWMAIGGGFAIKIEKK